MPLPLSSLPKIRPYVILGLSAFIVVCWLIAICADMATAESGNMKVTIGVWYTCVRNGDNPAQCVYNTDEHAACGEAKDHFRALQAFLILLIIVALPLLIAAILETIHKLALPGNRRVPGPLGIATVYVILAAFGILFSLIGFAINFAIPDRKFCSADASFSDAPGFTYSASPIVTLFAWLAMIAVLVVALLVPGPDDEPVAAKGTVGHGTVNEPGASPSAQQQKVQPV